MKDESRASLGRESVQRAIKRLQPLFEMHVRDRIHVEDQVRIGGENEGVARLGRHRLIQGVLVDDVTRDGKEVGLGPSDQIVPLDSQQSQENLLREIADVRSVPQASGEIAT